MDVKAADAVDSWASEVPWYDYASNSCNAPAGKSCGHYTQVVWAKSTEVGCGVAICDDKGQVWVCNYKPAGNYSGQKPYIASTGTGTGAGTGSDMTPQAVVSQSSTAYGGAAGYAADGNRDGVYTHRSVTHTRSETNPWWQMDLGAESTMTNIEVYNRTDCCSERLSNAKVFVSRTPFQSTNPATTEADGNVATYTLGNMANKEQQTVQVNKLGRYIRIQLPRKDYLSLAEVVVQKGTNTALVKDNSIVTLSHAQENLQGCIVNVETKQEYCLPVGKRSGYSLPEFIHNKPVYVNAPQGVGVMLSDWDNLSYNRLATFTGYVSNDELKQVKARNGEVLDFSQPRSMRVVKP